MEKRRYKALINGKAYTIVGPKSAEHLQTVTKLVNKQLEQIKHNLPHASTIDHAILLAVNAVSLQVDLQQELAQLKEAMKHTQSQQRHQQQAVAQHPGIEQLALDSALPEPRLFDRSDTTQDEEPQLKQSNRQKMKRKKHNTPAFKQKR